MTNIELLDIEKVLFLDIETVSAVYHYDDLLEETRKLWSQKMQFQSDRDGKTPEDLYEKAAIFAEFGKVVCVSCGFFVQKHGERQLRIKSFAGKDEKKLLQEFSNLLDAHFHTNEHRLCAHNGKEFDFPYLCRRMLIHGIQLPGALDIQGKKPWEINHLDTMEMWKFGDYKNFTSLSLLTHVFGIPTPKDDISGADVSRVFWEEDDLDRIIVYCQKDVVALAQVFLKYRREALIEDSQVIIA